MKGRIDAVVVGASAGAVEALGVLLPALPRTLAIPVIVVVHLPPNRASLMAELFRPRCQLDVREAEDKQPIDPATIWFAPPNYHLLIERDRSFALSLDEPVNFSRPSIDVLFESAADVYGQRLLAMVLTGANHDGAQGAQVVRAASGLVAVQDPATAFAPTMPALCIERAQPDLIGTLEELARYTVDQALGRVSS
jgi:two-component system, chemotaxis family, protein-glutamate methylesterase/glutaminase